MLSDLAEVSEEVVGEVDGVGGSGGGIGRWAHMYISGFWVVWYIRVDGPWFIYNRRTEYGLGCGYVGLGMLWS